MFNLFDPLASATRLETSGKIIKKHPAEKTQKHAPPGVSLLTASEQLSDGIRSPNLLHPTKVL